MACADCAKSSLKKSTSEIDTVVGNPSLQDFCCAQRVALFSRRLGVEHVIAGFWAIADNETQ